MDDFRDLWPNNDGDRIQMWNELDGVRGRWKDPWVLGGDFNVTRFISERSSSTVLNRGNAGYIMDSKLNFLKEKSTGRFMRLIVKNKLGP
ncbi:hypothetical protein BVC80_1481g6 [Macleaya cordata]|uniref:Endonuclease/exonuclease/phosphatase n=1 Tax=Macleaya cordata TaxID=56857 RepID=A0A200QNJ5_MACCD|nr:hypothetical protein BVC80_1481g6 [Macleaya cordata]